MTKATKRYKSKVTIYRDTRFDPTYKHWVNWRGDTHTPTMDGKIKLNAYLNTLENHSIEGSYQPLNKQVRWDSRILSYNNIINFDYMKIENYDTVNGDSETFYAFITDISYENDGMIWISFSVDFMNTYQWFIDDWGKAEIERGFVYEFKPDGDYTTLYNEVRHAPEPVGGDGCTRLSAMGPVHFTEVEGKDGTYLNDGYIKFVLFTLQPEDATKPEGTYLYDYSCNRYAFFVYNLNTGRCLDIISKDGEALLEGGNSVAERFASLGGDDGLFKTSSLVLDIESFDYIGIPFKAVMDGDHIKAIKLIHKIKGKKLKNLFQIEEYDPDTRKDVDNPGIPSSFRPQNGVVWFNNIKTGKTNPYVFSGTKTVSQNLQDWFKWFIDYNGEYQKILGKDIPWKILSSPWVALRITNGRGMNNVFDIALFNHLKLNHFTLARYGGVTENSKQMYAMLNYNRSETYNRDNLKAYEQGALLVDDSARDLPFYQDNYQMYMNANRNQLAQARANALMTKQMAQEGNAVTLHASQRAMAQNTKISNITRRQNSDINNLTNDFSRKNAGWQALGSTLSGTIQGGMTLGAKGALLGAGTGALSGGLGMFNTNNEIGLNNDITNAQNRATQQIMQAQNQATSGNAHENYAYQNRVATNNYEMALASQSAMLSDVANQNDVMAHQGTNQLWDVENGLTGVSWQLYTAQKATLYNVCLFFNLFGYAINRYENISNYMYCKSHFNYVKTSHAQIDINANQSVKDVINAVFDNGTTVWNGNVVNDFRTRDITKNTWN